MSGFNERAGFMFEPVKSVSNEVVHGEDFAYAMLKEQYKKC